VRRKFFEQFFDIIA
jgi:hypothetical protein